MGRLIICNGKQTDRPFYFKLTNTYIFSMEELCYFIYHNVDTITEELYQPAFLQWIDKEICLPDLSKSLEELIGFTDKKEGIADTKKDNLPNFKDIIVTLLCSSDYYGEDEIKQLLLVMEQEEKLTPFEKLKKKADNCLKYRQYTNAAKEYEKILSSKEAANLRKEEYGDLKHNLALAKLHMTGEAEAVNLFKEAYDNNQKEESLRQYFITLLLLKQEDTLKSEAEKYGISEEMLKAIEAELEAGYECARASADYKDIKKLREYKDTGRITQYNQAAEEIIRGFKQEFRLENS